MVSFKRINRSALSETIVHRKSHIISMIFLGIAGISYINTDMRSGGTLSPYWLSFFFFFISLIPLSGLCVSVFRDMHNVPVADVQMAMPLSASERFLSKLMTICYCWLFPYIFFHGVGNIFSYILNLYGSEISYEYNGTPTVFKPASFTEMFAANMKVFLWGLSVVLFIVAVVSLCASCVGSKAESAYLPVIMMIVISVLPLETKEYIKNMFSSVYACRKEADTLNLFGFGAVFYDMEDSRSVIMVIVNCLISLAVIAAAMFAYKKRDASTVGYPVVYRAFFEVLMILSLATVFQITVSEQSVIGLFIVFVGSLILRMIVSRKDITVKKTAVWTGIFALYYGLFIVFSYAACVTGGFGGNRILPDTSYFYSENYTVTVDYKCSKYRKDYSEYEDNSIYGFEDSVSFSSTIPKGKAVDVAAVFTKYAYIQNRMPGFFVYKMFGAGESYKDWYSCTLLVSCENINEKYVSVYNAEIYLDKNTASELSRELKQIK